jgi:Protein of unknown function (DUF1015)
MVRINPFRYLTDLKVPSYVKTPDSPRAVTSIEVEDICCSETSPCGSPHCSSCLPFPVVVLSSNEFCNRNRVNLGNVNEFIDKEMLHSACSNAFFIYSQTSGSHTQVGICCALSIEDYQSGLIKKHELTIADKKDVDTCNVFFDKV